MIIYKSDVSSHFHHFVPKLFFHYHIILKISYIIKIVPNLKFEAYDDMKSEERSLIPILKNINPHDHLTH